MSTANDAGEKSEDNAAPLPDTAGREAPLSFCVVGIGASAGGVEALTEILKGLRKDIGMAFVLMLHLPADHESKLAEILARVSPIPIAEAHDGMPIAPNRAYVLPAGVDAKITQGCLTLSRRTSAAGHHLPIDDFFRSLAKHQGQRAIGVVLSGSAPDGNVGIQDIKAAGGITFAQDDTARYTQMPRSAIATGAVDFVLPPEEIAHELGRIASHPLVANDGTNDSEAGDNALLPDIEPVLHVLRDTMNVDFSQYKRNTLQRRIARRMVLHRLEGTKQYLNMLRTNPVEAEALYQDLLINVTSFFRNPGAFEVLKSEVFPALTQDRSRHEPVRVWVLACSTGEEAYSVAMAYSEYVEAAGRSIPLQLYATDLNPVGIEKARRGVYAKGAVQGVSPERLRRFFVQVDGHYHVVKRVRDLCVFARHNVLTDTPFSRMDLVSCRNMLIYLGTELQQKVLPVMHYALRDRGYLFLGASETTGAYRELFELRNAHYKIYAKRATDHRVQLGINAQVIGIRSEGAGGVRGADAAALAADPHAELDRMLLSRYAPASVLVTGDLEILQYRGNTASFLAPAPGRATLNLLKMVRQELVLGVRAAVEAAKRGEAPSRQENLRFIADGVERRVNIEAIPVRAGLQAANVFLVLFEEPQGERAPTQPERAEQTRHEAGQEIERLRQELAATREYLQSVIEQQEASNEELQSANEEVQSSNEELQSINEELQTSNEEVQSANEELATVNDELHARNAELAQSNNDLLNLFSSVQLAIVMLDANLRIRRYTPMAEKLLNLMPTDVGRPLSSGIKSGLEIPGIDKLVCEVIESMATRELEVQDRDGHWYLLRVRPYRTLENRIDGALIVLVDVDSLKRSEEALRQQTELLNQAHEPIVMWELNGATIYWNRAAEETYGFTREQALGRKVHELLMTQPPPAAFIEELRAHGHWTGELVHTRRDAQKIIVESRMVLVGDARGRTLVVEANRPITERKESERVLRRLADDLVTADRNKDEFLAMLGHELRNPLAPVRNALGLLRSDAAEPADKRRALEIMDRQIGNMARLIDDLLDVSRITLSQIELRKARVNVVAEVARIVDENAGELRARDQRLRLSLPHDPIHVDADVVRLEQVFANLLNNAAKYTPHGGAIAVSVEEAPARDGDGGSPREVLIRVRDNGIGIASDKLPRVFDMFMRATRSMAQEQGGLGLGLTLVKRLVELHGGSVEAHSEGLGKGSEFVVRLPSAAGRAKSATDSAQPAQLTERRVLVVDDNPDSAESMARLLALAGHAVEFAGSGAEALAIAARMRPEVMLIDVSMPEMNGYDLARALHQRGLAGDALLVAVSGYGDPASRKKAIEAGFDDYLVKPAGAADLNRVLAWPAARSSQRDA
ncbi:MAG TPA: chemotaxis protein CheB [Burkholderiales bacterium]|nr:chemotaxis protein CheB [Burkholderiales bacterium]